MKNDERISGQLTVRPSAKEFSRYKKLVDSDWNETTLDAVLDLLWALFRDAESEDREQMELLAFLGKVHEENRPGVMPARFVENLRFLAIVFRDPHLPEMPIDIDFGKSRHAARAEAAIVYLLLQVDGRIAGEVGFFRDLQSLLYLHAAHVLLPRLQKAGPKAGHDSLAVAMMVHAFLVWRDEPSHMFYLIGALMGQLGRARERVEFLHRSLSATPIDDHSYLTKVSAYWGELLDIGEKDKAMEFLLKLSRNAPASYVAEIREMIMATAGFQAIA